MLVSRQTLAIAVLVLAGCSDKSYQAGKGGDSGAGAKRADGGGGAASESAGRTDAASSPGMSGASHGGAVPADAAASADPATTKGGGSQTPASPDAGILTAGTFDDRLNFEAFRSFWGAAEGAALQQQPGAGDPGKLITIHVHGQAGKPVPNAHVVVTTGTGDAVKTVLDVRTGGKGTEAFMTGWDGGDGGPFAVTATAGAAAPVTGTFTADTADWDLVLPDDAATPAKALDLAIVLDTTGSMGDELAFLKAEAGSIADSIKTRFPGVDARFSVIVYRDVVDPYVTRVQPFTADVATFKTFLAGQDADGGGDYPEAMEVALGAANQKLDWRPDAARTLFLIADAPPHDQDMGKAFTEIAGLRQAGVTVYPVGASGVGDLAERLMRRAALLTGGDYIFLTDDSGIGDPHAQPHIPCYFVQTLKNAMIAAVTAELSGVATDPQPDQILRTVGSQAQGVCTKPAP